MLEIAVVALLLLVLVVLPVLLVIKAAQLLLEPPANEIAGALEEKREHDWRQANAVEREQMVRKSCVWRIIGRVAGAGALVTAGFMTCSPTLAIMWSLAAWRAVKPIKEEIRDACSYRSTGMNDEPPFSW